MRVLVMLAFVACASAPPVRRFSPMDTTAVTDVLHAQAAAWNRGDLAAFMDAYAKIDNLVFTSGGHVRKGWQDAFDHYKAKYATAPKSMGHLVFEITQIDPVGADAAVVLGTWNLTESVQPGSGVFSLVFERRPEGWRIIHDHTSVATP
jgi:uncharacterized protein (TIGR02246 family)